MKPSPFLWFWNRRVLIVAVAVIWILAMFSCGCRSIVGRWRATFLGMPTAEYEFGADGRFQKRVFAAGMLMAESTGTYRVEDNTIIYEDDTGDIGLGVSFDPQTVHQMQRIVSCSRSRLVLENMTTGVRVTLDRY